MKAKKNFFILNRFSMNGGLLLESENNCIINYDLENGNYRSRCFQISSSELESVFKTHSKL